MLNAGGLELFCEMLKRQKVFPTENRVEFKVKTPIFVGIQEKSLKKWD